MVRGSDTLAGRIAGAVTLALLALAVASCDTSATNESGTIGVPPAHTHDAGRVSCFICDPAQRDPERLWCREHGRYEDRCWICQPQLEKKDRPYCTSHFLYEDECFLCHPELERPATEQSETPEPTEEARTEPNADGDLYCREHRVWERECGICQPQLAAQLRPGESLKVRFKSALSASKAGVQTASPRVADSRATIAALCKVAYNGNRLARVTPLASGLVRRVITDLGERVRAGDPLAEIHSAEVAAAKTAFLSALIDHRVKEQSCERLKRLAQDKIPSQREVQEADAACKVAALAKVTARQQLVNFGLSAEEVAEVESSQDGSAIVQVRAPFDGTIVERCAVTGEAVEPGTALFTVADLSDMWVELSMPGDRATLLDVGLTVEATFPDLPGAPLTGSIVWVAAALDERTRTLTARAVVPNPEGKLKAGMFGEARIAVESAGPALRVPRDAIQKVDGLPFVFVKLEDDLYALRRVALGAGTARSHDVLQGLDGGEDVVTAGTFTVLSEYLKSRLGAGCVDE